VAPAHRGRTLRGSMTRASLVATLIFATLSGLVLAAASSPAVAATPGTPFVCNPSLYFQSIGTATQLYEEAYNAGGGITFTPIGTATSLEYNAMGYDPLDNLLYASTSNEDGAQDLVSLDANGTQTVLTNLPLPTGFIAAGFDPSGDYLADESVNGQENIYDLEKVFNGTSTGATTIPETTVGGAPFTDALEDWTYSYGYLWGVDATTSDVVRVDPTNGDVVQITQDFMVAGTYGAAWTFGNGNLVFSNNAGGEVYQVAVQNPTSAAPTVSEVSEAEGKTTNNNDGASCEGPAVDLGIVKSGPTSAPVSTPVTYTLTVTDDSASADSSGYTVTDDVPAGFTNVATTTAGCAATGNDVVCVEPEIDAGETFTITITATTPATGGAYANTATVTGNESDPNPDNNSSTVTTDVGFANVSVAKTATNTSPEVGTSDTFTLTAANSASSTAASGQVVVTDPLPAGLTYESASSTLCPTGSCITETGGIVTWTIANLAPGANATLQIVVDVATPNDVTNTAGFTQAFPNSIGATSGSSNPVTLTPAWANVTLNKSVTNSNPSVGTDDTFTLSASSSASSTASTGSLVVTDPLPAGLTYVSSSTTACADCVSASGQTVTWTLSNGLAPGATAQLQIVVKVTGTTLVDNTASYTQQVPSSTGTTTGSSNTVPVTPVLADVTVTKSATTTTPGVGTDDTFTLVATNAGPDSAGTVTVTDVVPAGLAIQSTHATVGSASVSGQTVTWNAGILGPPGQVNSGTLTIVVQVNATSAVTNSATFTQTTPNSAGATTGTSNSVTLTPQWANVTVSKSVTDATPTVTSQDTFTLAAANSASSTAGSGTVTVTDPLPTGLTYLSSTPSNTCSGSCVSVSGQTVTWTIVNLAPGASATLQIVVDVAASSATVNTATFTETTPSSAGATTGSSNSVTVTPSFADVSLEKAVSSTTPEVGTDDTFTLTAANAAGSTSDSGEVVVTDDLPAGLTYVSSTPSNTCSGPCVVVSGQTVTWTIVDLAADASATLQIVVTVDTTAHVDNSATFTQTSPNGSGGTTGVSNTVTLTPSYAVVKVAKSASSTDPQLGSDDTFTIAASNSGPSASGQVVVTDVLASGLVYESSTASDGTVTVSGQTVTWTIADLPAPAAGVIISEQLQIVVLVNTRSTVTNSATFTQTTPSASGATTGSTDTVTLVPQYGILTLSKALQTTSPQVGSDGTYAVTVTDSGPDAATGVVVVDDLPASESYVSARVSTGTVAESSSSGSQVITWDVGSLADGSAATMTLVVKFVSSGSVVNLARATDTTFDSGGLAAQASATATVTAPVVVPPTHTGEPWSGWPYWLLVAVLGFAGAFAFEAARRRRLLSGSD
jgi:uncharacterized repeat protein (TIGR01451 family)/fimbrial isopeptide formation D2 family protein